jgi:hypothetical protein
VIAALALAAGCSAVAPFDAAMLAGVARGEEALVMLRFVVTDQDGKQVAPFPGLIGDDNLGLALGRFETGGVPTEPLVAARFPTAASRAEGIVYVLLPPGYYYLAIQGARRTDVVTYAARSRALPRWRIAVPAGVPVLHAGTFALQGQSERMLLGDVLITAIDQAATVILDEGEAARSALARDIPGLPSPVTRLAVRQEGPILLGTPPR